MKKFLIPFVILTQVLFISSTFKEKINVVTTLEDFASITKEIGGDRVDVIAIAKGCQNPHYLEGKPSFMKRLNKADLLIYNGLQLEIGWLPLIVQGARNPKIAYGAKGNLDCSKGIHILEVPQGEVDRSMGDVHPEGNPHYTLDPRNGIIIANRIFEKLKELSPDDEEYFKKNLDEFLHKLERKIEEWEKRMEPYRGTKVVTYHKQWEYLAEWLGFKIVGEIEDKPGIPPSPRHLSWLISFMKEEKIPLIIAANFDDIDTARKVSQKTGATLLILPAFVGGEEEVKTYLDLFETIVSKIEKGLKR